MSLPHSYSQESQENLIQNSAKSSFEAQKAPVANYPQHRHNVDNKYVDKFGDNPRHNLGHLGYTIQYGSPAHPRIPAIRQSGKVYGNFLPPVQDPIEPVLGQGYSFNTAKEPGSFGVASFPGNERHSIGSGLSSPERPSSTANVLNSALVGINGVFPPILRSQIPSSAAAYHQFAHPHTNSYTYMGPLSHGSFSVASHGSFSDTSHSVIDIGTNPPQSSQVGTHGIVLPSLNHKSVQHSSLSDNSTSNDNSYPKHTGGQVAQHSFAKLVPLLQKVNTSNFGAYLVEALAEYHAHVPLDDVFNLLYNAKFKNGIHLASSELRSNGLAFFRLIVDNFKPPQNLPDNAAKTSLFPKVNFHEFLRTFLALKILFDSLHARKPGQAQPAIPRVSIYKAYCIVCLRLIDKYPAFSKPLDLEKNILLCSSKLGKLLKLIYPNVYMKRLGRRGQSKAHYIGLSWNELLVDDAFLDLLDLEVHGIIDHSTKSSRHTGRTSKLPLDGPPGPEIVITPSETFMSGSVSQPLLTPLQHTFVDLSYTYPNSDCSPRVWKTVPNSVPQPSKWASGIIETSTQVLRGHHIDCEPLIQNIHDGVFLQHGPHSISGVVVLAFERLSEKSSPKEHFFHLYLVIVLLLFPIVLASDKEICPGNKILLRASINQCVAKLELGDYSTRVESSHIRKFTRILRSMTHLNEMTSKSINIAHTGRIFKQNIRGIQFHARKVDQHSLDEISAMEQIVIRGAVMAGNAYNYNFCSKNATSPETGSVEAIRNVAQSIRLVMLMATDTMSQMPLFSDFGDKPEKDVPYQIFSLSAAFFHEVTLKYPSISQLPIPIIIFIILHFTKEMSNSSLGDLDDPSSDVSAEPFNCWCIFSSMFQEYMSVHSEVVALSQKV